MKNPEMSCKIGGLAHLKISVIIYYSCLVFIPHLLTDMSSYDRGLWALDEPYRHNQSISLICLL